MTVTIRSNPLQPEAVTIQQCPKCGKILTYEGLGEYRCDACEESFFNEYGVIRNYLDDHPYATILEVSQETGVSKLHIRQYVDKDYFEVVGNDIRTAD